MYLIDYLGSALLSYVVYLKHSLINKKEIDVQCCVDSPVFI